MNVLGNNSHWSYKKGCPVTLNCLILGLWTLFLFFTGHWTGPREIYKGGELSIYNDKNR
tara:strand:+ start:996 stop:1172 length:177 start_codon:yes stop_codon:yes gene_type:complete